jgi:hypothetical protein
MSDTKPLTRQELAAVYTDEKWRDRLLELLSLVSILRECIIEKTYKPSDALNDAIVLSPEGAKIRSKLILKHDINAKDAKILTLLGMVHIEPLVDIDRTDLKKLSDAISKEIIDGDLRYPLIFGRELYDRAATLFLEERDYLSHEDTLRLLNNCPQGVFQTGFYLLGPYGIYRRNFERKLTPTTSIPLQHCADAGCSIVHRIQLSTSIEATVNQGRPTLDKVLEEISEDPSEWNGFVSDFTEQRFNDFETRDDSTLPFLIGDAFSESELKALILHGVDIEGQSFYGCLEELNLKGNAASTIENLNRAQLLQILFMNNDSVLSVVIDSAVRENLIVVPSNEVRLPRVNSRSRSGAWRLRSQLSRLGISSGSLNPDLPLLRLAVLSRAQFDNGQADEMDELAWILRGVTGETADVQLAEFLRTSKPSTIVETLILARRANASRVCSELGIPLNQNNEALRDAILWKLGFPLPRKSDHRDDYWHLHHSLESLAKTALVDLSSTAEGLRAASSDYFVSLEKFLFDSLCFATWALLQDH